jgi:ribosomal protein S27AE
MRVLVIAAIVCAGLLMGYYLVRVVFDQTPDVQAPPSPLTDTRRIAARMPNARSSVAPPRSRAERLRNRFRVCLRDGHTFRVAFPAHKYRHQCTKCGAVQRIETIAYRPEFR